MFKGGIMKFYEAEIFIEARFETVRNQREFLKYCEARLQLTSMWTPALVNLIDELHGELDYLENKDML